jgi:hypothetical protein
MKVEVVGGQRSGTISGERMMGVKILVAVVIWASLVAMLDRLAAC